jgi:hypothetical protein
MEGKGGRPIKRLDQAIRWGVPAILVGSLINQFTAVADPTALVFFWLGFANRLSVLKPESRGHQIAALLLFWAVLGSLVGLLWFFVQWRLAKQDLHNAQSECATLRAEAQTIEHQVSAMADQAAQLEGLLREQQQAYDNSLNTYKHSPASWRSSLS